MKMKKTNKFISVLLCFLMAVVLIPTVAHAATLTTVMVKKTDTSGKPLEGAVFTLTGTGNSIDNNYRAASDKNGIAEFVDVTDGTYDLAEETAPAGYVLSDKVYHIAVYDGAAHLVVMPEDPDANPEYLPYETITFVNDELPTYPVTVKKTDESGNPLEGAVFTLTGTGNSIDHDYEAVSGKDGIATFNVNDGYYTLAEKTAPKGYVKSDKTYEISVWGGKAHFVAETDNGSEYSDYETVIYVNEKIPGSDDKEFPPAGSSSLMALWLVLLSAGACTAIGTIVYGIKE